MSCSWFCFVSSLVDSSPYFLVFLYEPTSITSSFPAEVQVEAFFHCVANTSFEPSSSRLTPRWPDPPSHITLFETAIQGLSTTFKILYRSFIGWISLFGLIWRTSSICAPWNVWNFLLRVFPINKFIPDVNLIDPTVKPHCRTASTVMNVIILCRTRSSQLLLFIVHFRYPTGRRQDVPVLYLSNLWSPDRLGRQFTYYRRLQKSCQWVLQNTY